MSDLVLVIPGRAVPAKNNSVMIKGRNLILPSPQYRAYKTACVGTKKQIGYLTPYGNIQFSGPVLVDAHWWFNDYRWWPDLHGLMQGLADILEASGILANDKQIVSWGNSRIEGLGEARTEITIYETECNWWRMDK